jgi:hypothetical protein
MKSNMFERICRGWGWSLLLALVTASGCGGQQAGDAALASSGAEATVAATAPDFSPTFFSARADLRKCASPMCGGYFVASVNQSWIRCPNGTYSRECYVASIDLSALKLSSDQEAQVRKAIGTSPDIVGVLLQGKLSAPPVTTAIAPVYPTLVAAHAWLAPAPTPIKGAYFGLADSGIVCITAPCPSIRGLLLNQTLKASFSQVDLSAAPGTDKEKADAIAAMSSGEGLVAVGPSYALTGSLVSPAFRAIQFFRLVKAQDPCLTVKCSAGNHCEPRQVECFVAPCPPVGVCVPDPVPPVHCGGIAGIRCPGEGQCVDDPSDTCDPAAGGADCGGICVCKQTVDCIIGSTFDPSPSVCACVPSVTPIPCGKSMCGAGDYCCNASCGMCAPRGAMCIQIVCDSTAQ